MRELTVTEDKAKNIVDLVKTGSEVPAVRSGSALQRKIQELMSNDTLGDEKTRKALAGRRLTELILSDDEKIALGAVRAELGLEQQNINVGVQVNNHLKYDPAVVEALQSLGLEEPTIDNN